MGERQGGSVIDFTGEPGSVRQPAEHALGDCNYLPVALYARN